MATGPPNETAARKAWMSALARAPEAELARRWSDYGDTPAFDWLRPPEIGSVMLRGRAGAIGAGFNLGEMTVTRCSLRLADGTVGHAYVQGRSKAKAETAALIDALMQGPAADRLRATVLDPLDAARADRARTRAAKAAATKVEFFTMVRGEDA